MAKQYKLKKETRKGVSGIDYEAELNPQQYAAVSSPPGPALVIAGAGSGKTRTLTYRVAYLLDQDVDPRSLLLLTFTNKAAREMMERVKELIPRDLSEMWSGTFHSIGNRMLRRHAEEVGLTRSFSIMDRDDQKSLMNTVIAECEINTKERRFPKADVLISIFSLIENTGSTLEEVLEVRYPYFEEWAEEIAKVEDRYRSKKLEVNSVDFDDLLLLPLKLLQENDLIRKGYQKRFQYLLVDEYQDTNHVQSELIDILARPQLSVMVVGDDAQSIYSWRGADMDNILSFPERYENATVYKIETNYRSVPEVLELSNAAIKVNRKQFTKTLNAARTGGRMTPALIPLEDPRTQANFVAQRILELRDEGIEMEEIAILYRAHYQSLEIQMELTSRNIPFEITSGLRFFEQSHIKDIAAFLRFVVNRKDEVSFKRFCLLLPGIGNMTAEKMWRSWLKTGHQNEENPPKKYSDVLCKFKVPAKAAKDWEQLCYTMDELVTPDGFARPSEMITSVLEGVYDEYMRQSFDNYENRRQDIEQLILYSETFDDILELLGQLSLMSSVDGDPSGKKEELDGEKLTLSSIHQAKGLEWKVVFIIWLTDGMFPNGRVLEADDEDMLEEERRLFYVALTRAKDELYLTYPQLNPKSYSGDIITRPSRFLDECPEELMEQWEVGPAW
ncbi:MAG: UvrD-helicase domain-containing protein [Akkermansiaceae bacterium]|nr:UvrD-helicase domain-containing protein [bacterium]MDB4332253.1 UvrD-helicase domain-containing protein [Akkermansiaceae bacterium]MDB4386819.1 UvrD-helicase domain-containing protein [Akkermansiaceae bacterium]